jgi:hypothetical protein
MFALRMISNDTGFFLAVTGSRTVMRNREGSGGWHTFAVAIEVCLL